MTDEHLNDIFHALADPTRRAVLQRLSNGEATVTELATPFAMSQPAISKHLKVLESAGLISRSRTAQWRPCRLETGSLKEAAAWIEHYVQLKEESYDRLEDLLDVLQADRQGRRPGEGSAPPREQESEENASRPRGRTGRRTESREGQ